MVTLHCCRHFISSMAAYNQMAPLPFEHSHRPHSGMSQGEVLRRGRDDDKPTPLDIRDALDRLLSQTGHHTYPPGWFDHHLKIPDCPTQGQWEKMREGAEGLPRWRR